MAHAATPPATGPAPALSRGLELLEVLNTEGACSLEHLAAVTGFPKTSVARLMQSLVAAGAVERDAASKRFHARMRLMPIAVGQRSLLDVGRPVLVELCRTVSQTAELYRHAEGALTMVDRCEPEDAAVRVAARVGFMRSDSEFDALRQVVLAFADEGPDQPPEPYWAWQDGATRREVPPAEKTAVVEQVRKARAAIDLSINSNAVRRYAAPILADSRLMGVLAIAQFATPAAPDVQPAWQDAVRAAAERLSTQLST